MILSDFPWLLMSQQMFTDIAECLFIQRGSAKFQMTKELISMKSLYRTTAGKIIFKEVKATLFQYMLSEVESVKF